MRWILAFALLFAASGAMAQMEALEDDTPPDLIEKAEKSIKRASPSPQIKAAAPCVAQAAAAYPSAIPQTSSAPHQFKKETKPTPSRPQSASSSGRAAAASSTSSAKPAPVEARHASPRQTAEQTKVAAVKDAKSPSQKSAKSQTPQVASTSYAPGAMSGEHANNLRHFKQLATRSSSEKQYSRTYAGVPARTGPSRYVRPIHLKPGQTSPVACSSRTSNKLAYHIPTAGRAAFVPSVSHNAAFSTGVLRYSSYPGVVWNNNSQAQSYKTYR